MLSGLTVQHFPLETVLRKQFYIFSGFYPGQRDIIEQLIQGQRVLAIQRTGWGKSLLLALSSFRYSHRNK